MCKPRTKKLGLPPRFLMSCDFLRLAAVKCSSAFLSVVSFLCDLSALVVTEKPLIECGAAPSRHSFQRFQKYLRTTKREDAEAKALQCLGEGAGAEEKGELKLFWIFLFVCCCFFSGHKGDLKFACPPAVLQILYGHIFSVWASTMSLLCT